MLGARMLVSASAVGMASFFKKVPIAYAVSDTHTNFPVYVKPSAITGLGSITLAQAQSARFYSDQSKTTELAREIVSADEIHVKVPSLNGSTTIYMDYDGVRSDYAVTDTYGAQAVWGGHYKLVWHKGAGEDSTANGANATGHGGINAGDKLGKMGDATDFNGSTEYLSYPNLNLGGFGNDWSITMWVAIDSLPSQLNDEIFLWTPRGEFDCSLQVDEGDTVSDGELLFESWAGSSDIIRSNTVMTLGRLYKVRVVNDSVSSAQHIYVDGALKGTGSLQNPNSTTDVNRVGSQTSSRRFHDGLIDEFRIESVSRSPNWEAAEYANQNDPSTFFGTATAA